MIVGMLRVKNEQRWIVRAIQSILPICEKVLVMDDHSTDATPRLAAVLPRTEVFESPFTGLDECRDKNFLMGMAMKLGAAWIVCIDGDEVLAPFSIHPLLNTICNPLAHCVSMRIPYLWDREDMVRMDGVYGEFRRHSAFRPSSHRFTSSDEGGFHCGNVPQGCWAGATTVDAIQLLHYGYMDRQDRIRKYCWYNAIDPANAREDRYRHIAAGLDVDHEDLIAMQIGMRGVAGLPPLMEHQLLPPAPGSWERTGHAGPMLIKQVTNLS